MGKHWRLLYIGPIDDFFPGHHGQESLEMIGGIEHGLDVSQRLDKRRFDCGPNYHLDKLF